MINKPFCSKEDDEAAPAYEEFSPFISAITKTKCNWCSKSASYNGAEAKSKDGAEMFISKCSTGVKQGREREGKRSEVVAHSTESSLRTKTLGSLQEK